MGTIGLLHPARTRWTIELLSLVLRTTVTVEMNMKNVLAVRRPQELSAQVQPMIQTPPHGAFPSGHAGESFAVATVMAELTKDRQDQVYGPNNHVWTEQFMRQAARIATNRVVAGVHYPIDSSAGQILGTSIGLYLLERFRAGTGTMHGVYFDANQCADKDFDPRAIADAFDAIYSGTPNPGAAPYVEDKATWIMDSTGDQMLNYLWRQAKKEWT
nr:phosphatase PAP2 family protein [Rubricella aquisinus]